jgi:hypothetical protein
MSLAERLEAETPKLSFPEWLISLEPKDRQALEEAARNPAWSTAALVRIIVEEGGPNSKDLIGKWRHGVTG